MRNWLPFGRSSATNNERVRVVPRSPEQLAADAYNAHLPNLQGKWNLLVQALLSNRPVYPRGMVNGHQLYGVRSIVSEIGARTDAGLQLADCMTYAVLSRDSAIGRRALLALQGERSYDNVEVHPRSREALYKALGRDTVAVCMEILPRGSENSSMPDSVYSIATIPTQLLSEDTAAAVQHRGLIESVSFYEQMATAQDVRMTMMASMLQGPLPRR